MQFSTRNHPAVLAAGRHLLPGTTLRADPIVLESDDIEGVRAFCRADRLSGLLATAVGDGAVVVEDERLTAAIVEDWHAALEACVVLEALLVRVRARLDDAAIRWMATKGPAIAHLDFEDPTLRAFGDIDIIVHPDDWRRAIDLLDDDALSRPHFHHYVDRFGKGVTVLVDDMEVDVHRRFAIGRFGVRPDMAECFDNTTQFELASESIPAPSAAIRLLHACFHATLGGNRELRAFRDVAQIALGRPDAVAEVWEIAHRWEVESVVASAVLEAWDRLQLPNNLDIAVQARRIDINRADARALRVFANEDRFRRQSLTTLGALPWRNRPTFVHSTWMMSREHRR